MGCTHCISTVRFYGHIDNIRLTRNSFTFRMHSDNENDVPFRTCRIELENHNVLVEAPDGTITKKDSWLDLAEIENGWVALVELPVTELRKDLLKRKKQQKAMYDVDRCCVQSGKKK